MIPNTGDRDLASISLSSVSDPDLRYGLIQIFAAAQALIDQEGIDLVILAARKLACVYQLLVTSGMTPLDCPGVISDRSFPVSRSDQTEVLILDDSLVVGTTLDRLVRRILDDCPNAHVICRTVVRDRDQSATFILKELDFAALYERTSLEVEHFSAQIVETLAEQLIPFFSDFPVTRLIELNRGSWMDYLRTPGWLLADVTTSLFKEPTYRALVQIPHERRYAEFLSKLPPPLSRVVDGIKVRTYVTEHADNADLVQARLVAIAMLAPCTPSDLNQCFEALPSGVQAAYDQRWHLLALEYKHRFIQFYVSLCVLAEIWNDVAHVTRPRLKGPAELLDDLQIALAVGLGDGESIAVFGEAVETQASAKPGTYETPSPLRLDRPTPSPLLEEADLEAVFFANRELIASVGVPTRPEEGGLTKIGLVFAQAICSVFGYVDKTYEREQRSIISRFKSRAEYEEYIASHPRVLDQGFTLRDLVVRLLPDLSPDDTWSRSLLSLGIDAGNDLGIIVPVTQVDEVRGIVYRCYRVGETAYLADTPLASHAGAALPLDVMSESVVHGAVLKATRVTIESLFERPARITNEDPIALVRQVLPGNLSAGFTGTVRNVDETGSSFTAEVTAVGGTTELVARFPKDQVLDADWSLIKPGSRFYWSLFQSDLYDARSRTSTVRVRRIPRLDPGGLTGTADALASWFTNRASDYEESE